MKSKIKALRDELEKQIKGEDVHIGSLDIINRLDEILESPVVSDGQLFPSSVVKELLRKIKSRISLTLHNLLGHPLMEIAYIFGLRRLGNWIHNVIFKIEEDGN